VVAAAAGLDRQPLMIDVDAGAVARHVEALPWVDRARARRVWPSTVRIVLTERAPTAALAGPNGGVALVDVTGRVLDVVGRAPGGLVAVTGLPAVGPPGSEVAPAARGALVVTALMAPALVSRAPELALLPDGELELHLAQGAVARLGGPDEMGEKLEALLTVLTRADVRGVRVIDLRVPRAPALTRG
jgi:cell division protein FtsQ